MLKSIAEEMHDDGHPDGGQGSCKYCLFENPLPPAHEVTKNIMGLIDTITDDYEKKYIAKD